MSKFVNQYDNADLSENRSAKDIAASFLNKTEMDTKKLYYETLKLEAELQASTDTIRSRVVEADGCIDSVDIALKDNVADGSEFEQARLRTLVKLNGLARTKGGLARLKQWYANLDTDSIFELSSKIANFMFDEGRHTSVKAEFKLY